MKPTELKTIRVELGLSQAKLAEALGVASNTVARWERGKLEIAHPAILSLALEQLRHAEDINPCPHGVESPDMCEVPHCTGPQKR